MKIILSCRSRGHPNLQKALCRLWGGYELLALPGKLSPAYLLPVALTLELCKSPSVPVHEQGDLLLLLNQNDSITHMRSMCRAV